MFPPMSAADEFQLIRPDLAFWQAYEPAVKCDLSCCARRVGSQLVFFDPIPLAALALEELATLATPAAIVLTNGNHARAAAKFRARLSIPILAHAEAAPELGVSIDGELEDGAMVADALSVIALPGAAAGEIALCGGGVLHVGDALINVEPAGFSLLPNKYCTDARELRRSLGKLLRSEFELLTFAHGLPLISQARRRLENLLA
jgi:glyoxylase-like metal-dependent hydrolase (beta-lactamase superfamily II)